MAFPNYYYPATYQSPAMQMQQQFQQMQPTQAQTTGFIRVPHEDVARNWNVPPGMSFTFIDENAPYCYIKTAGMSQLDRPRFEKYRLVKEEEPSQAAGGRVESETPQMKKDMPETQYALKSDVETLQKQFEELKQEVMKHESVNATEAQ